ncbi:rho GTPase-activating protein 17b isoform X1 [Gadus morhua]|uniref:Rho GTPase activating protein 17b n=1 Tax=Gadus morhua TaxID=8049 RepID=A0A8C5CPM2_GADMO|nr:rho GTPase-activating protein 17-like isoform X1 [Gadus morhua]
MKKQFNRMKLIANQTVGRAEKTEVLSEDLLQIERRMELVRTASHNAHKRLVLCLQGQPGTDSEKRHKKLPLTSLSQAMQDGGSQLGEESLIGKMMDVCGEAESRLASVLMQHEVTLERDVLEPFNQLTEVEIPNVLKMRKQLGKLVLDYDSAKARWYQATRTNNQAMASKVDSLKDEMDEALNKVEICKDQLSADMYNFASKEGDYASYYVLLLEAQADYHRRSLAVLETAIPAIQLQQDSWMEKPAFGTALEEHLERSHREIALPLEACVMMLLETGMKEEGLFRIAAGSSKLKKLKAALDCSTSQLEEFYSDPHAVAGALKSYLRELPEPLMTFGLYDEWLQASCVSDPDKRLQSLWSTCHSMPNAHKANLRYLVKFLAKLAQDSDVNKMTPPNIAIVLGPNLLWPKTEGTLAEMAAATSLAVVAIIEPIIQHADWFFPEEVDFNVSGMFALPSHLATPEPDPPGLEKRRPGSMGGQEGDGHTPRKDSTGNKPPEPAPRRLGTLNRKHLSLPAFKSQTLPLPEAGDSPTRPQTPVQSPTLAIDAEPLCLVDGGGGGGGGESGGRGSHRGLVQVDSWQPQPLSSPTIEKFSPARENTSTPPPQRNGSAPHLTVGTPHSQGGSRGTSPHMMRRGTKKQAPAPPRQASPFTPQLGSQQTPGSAYHPPIAPKRHSGKESPQIHAPSHPPPQPPLSPTPPVAGGAGETDRSPPSTPTPPSTPPLDAPQPYPLVHPSFHSGSLPRPTRPAPKPRPRPSGPPPPQPPANEGENGLLNSASKVITGKEASPIIKPIGRALIPVVAVDQPEESSAGEEPSPSPVPQSDPEDVLESTIM